VSVDHQELLETPEAHIVTPPLTVFPSPRFQKPEDAYCLLHCSANRSPQRERKIK